MDLELRSGLFIVYLFSYARDNHQGYAGIEVFMHLRSKRNVSDMPFFFLIDGNWSRSVRNDHTSYVYTYDHLTSKNILRYLLKSYLDE